MSSIELKIKVLHKSIDNLCKWLDKCQESVAVAVPLEDFMEADPSHLTQLALQYKDLLLKLKERYSIIQELKTLLKEVTDENNRTTSNRLTSLECSKISKQVTTVHTKWSSICQQVKQLYSKLSIALASVSGRSPSPVSPTATLEKSTEGEEGDMTSNGSNNDSLNRSKLDDIVTTSSIPLTSPLKTTSTGLVSNGSAFTPQPTIPQPTIPQSPVLRSTMPQSTVPQSPVLRSTVPQSPVLRSAVPQSPVLRSTVRQSSVPQFNVPQQSNVTQSTILRQSSVPHQSSNDLHKSLDDLLDALKEEVEGTTSTNSHHAKTQTLPSNMRGIHLQETPPTSPKPARGHTLPHQRSSDLLYAPPPCRLSRKLEENTGQLDMVERSVMRGVACLLESVEIESRLKDMRSSLTLLDLQSEELNQLNKEADSIPISPPSPSARATSKTPASSYTLMELACCKGRLGQLYQTVRELQSVCNDQICNLELALELVEQFEGKATECLSQIASYERIVLELQNCSLEGNSQPWETATRALESYSSCNRLVKGVVSFSEQLLCLEPHFDGNSIREKVKAMETHLGSLKNDSESIILGAIAHRDAFAHESLAILNDWLLRSEEEVKRARRERNVTLAFKKSKNQEIKEHLGSLQQTSDQLEHILKLSTLNTVLHIPQLESIRASREEIRRKREKLTGLSTEFGRLSVKHKEEIDLPLKGKIKPYEEVKIPFANKKPSKGLVYTEIEAKANPGIPRTSRHSSVPPPVYSEIIIQPIIPQMESIDIVSPKKLPNSPSSSFSFFSSQSTPTATTTTTATTVSRSIVHSNTSEKQHASPSNSPSPPLPASATTEGHTLNKVALSVPVGDVHESAKPVKPVTPPVKPGTPSSTEPSSVKYPVKPFRLPDKPPRIVNIEAPTREGSSREGSVGPSLGGHDYDIPRSSSLHILLMEFIDQEYSQMETSINSGSNGFKTPLLNDNISLLPDGRAKQECRQFLRQIEEHRTQLHSILQEIAAVELLQQPVASLYHDQKEVCKEIGSRLDEINDYLTHHNEMTNNLHDSLSSLRTMNESRVNFLLLQLESELFDVSCFHHHCHMSLRDKLKLLRRKENDLLTLQSDIELLSFLLKSAQDLLSQRESLMNVQQYLSQCKEMHHKLAEQSGLRQEAATKIRNLLFTPSDSSPPSSPSPISLQLLDQLRNIETQWVNVIHDLMNAHQLEPILIKHTIQNIAKELKSLEAAFPGLDYEGIDLETIHKTLELCQAKLKSCKDLDTSVRAMKERVEHLKSIEGNEPTYDYPRMFATPLPQDSPSHTMQTHSHTTQTQTDSILPSRRTSLGTVHCDMTVDYEKVAKTTGLLINLVERIVSRLESKVISLGERRGKVESFWSNSTALSEWMYKMKVDVKDKRGRNENIQGMVEVIVSKKDTFSSLQEMAKHFLSISSLGPKDKESVEGRRDKIAKEWQLFCHSLPLNIQVIIHPSDDPLSHLQPPEEFDDVTQMVEWLILVESMLQPRPLAVGNTANVKKQLQDIQAIQGVLNKKSPEYHRFMKSGRHSDHSDSDGSSPTQSRGESPPKVVKFVDENTIERHHRKKQIEQDNILETILSEDELDTTKPGGGDHSPLAKDSVMSPLSPTMEEAQQLSVIWTGVLSTLKQRKQVLESVLDIWSGFESKKSACEQFMDRSEAKLVDIYSGLKNATSIAALQIEMAELKTLSEEAHSYQHKIGTLNDLTTDLIQRHRAKDDVHDLQESMTTLNIRWKKVNECYLKNKSAIDQMTTAWAGFYQQYQPLVDFIKQLETEMEAYTPPVNDILAMQKTVEKLKFTQKELVARSGSLNVIKQYNVKLQESLCRHMTELTVVSTDIELLIKEWKSLTQRVEDRYQFLEKSYSERKDVLGILSRCETWCKRAEEHLKGRGPTIADLSRIHLQRETQKEFETELKERQNQLSMATARAKQMTSNFTVPGILTAEMNSEDLVQYFTRLETKLEEIGKLLVNWVTEMDTVSGAMDEFQMLSTQFSQNMTEIHSKVPETIELASTLPELRRQLESWQLIEKNNNGLGRVLEAMVASQRKLMGLGVQLNTDAIQLVKKYHTQWNDFRKTISSFLDAIKKTMWKFDPKNVTMILPRGWTKAMTAQGTPYYIDTLSGSHTQWQHPELSELYRSFVSRFRHSFYPSPAYSISLRLRCIQKAIQFEHLPTHVAMETFNRYNLRQDPHMTLSTPEMTEMALSLFHKAASLPTPVEIEAEGGPLLTGAKLDVNRSVELSVSWIHDVFDLTHTGFVNALSFEVAMVCLSSTKMDEKHKALFNIMSRGRTTVDRVGFMSFLETLVQIPQSMCDTQYCSLDMLEAHVNDCFRKYATGTQLHSVGYVAWAQAEPLPIAWLPILHRMAAAETMEHNVKCSVCRQPTIIGFRYKCLQCTNFNMCQECYWSGKTAKDHDRSKHFMEEYCISPDERGHFFRTLGTRGKRAKSSPRRTNIDGHQTASPPHNASPDYHSLSLKRDLSPSMNSLNTISTSSLGSMSMERRGSLSQLPILTPDTSLSQPHGNEIANPLSLLDELQRVKKLRDNNHMMRVGGPLPTSHSFDHGRIASGSMGIDMDPAPPLPPRNMVKKRSQVTEPSLLKTSVANHMGHS